MNIEGTYLWLQVTCSGTSCNYEPAIAAPTAPAAGLRRPSGLLSAIRGMPGGRSLGDSCTPPLAAGVGDRPRLGEGLGEFARLPGEPCGGLGVLLTEGLLPPGGKAGTDSLLLRIGEPTAPPCGCGKAAAGGL